MNQHATRSQLSSAKTSNSKKEQYADYMRFYNLEKIISEMANSVVHEWSPNPIVYMIKYLTGLLTDEERQAHNIDIPPPYPQGFPIVHYPKMKNHNILSSILTRDLYNKIKHNKTKYNNNINHLTKLNDSPTDTVGWCIVDEDCWLSFEHLVVPVIKAVHRIDNYKNNDNFFKGQIGVFNCLKDNEIDNLDNIEKNWQYIQFEFFRNVEGYAYNTKNIKVKEDIIKTVINWISEGLWESNMTLYTNEKDYSPIIEKINQDENKWLEDTGFNSFKGIKEGRCVYANENNTIFILINFANHLKLVVRTATTPKLDIVSTYNKSMTIMKHLSHNLTFIVNNKYGYITSDISCLGYGFKIVSDVPLVNIINNIGNKNVNINEVIANYNFTSTRLVETSIIATENLLYEKNDELVFLTQYFNKLNEWILFNQNLPATSLSFAKETFNYSNSIFRTYNSVYDKIKYIISSNNRNINNIITVSKETGKLLLFDRLEYYSFYTFIAHYWKTTQWFNINEFNHISKPENPRDITDVSSPDILSKIKNINICLFRNIKNMKFSINPSCDKTKVITEVKAALEAINSKGFFGEYISLSDEQGINIVKERGLCLEHNEKYDKIFLDGDYPNNRAVIKCYLDNIYLIINDIDNIKFIYNISNLSERGDREVSIDKDMVNLIKIMNEVNKYIKFEYDNKFGFFVSDADYIGTGMKVRVQWEIKNWSDSEINNWIKDKMYKWSRVGKDNVIEISNVMSIGWTEIEIMANVLFYIKDLVTLDKNI